MNKVSISANKRWTKQNIKKCLKEKIRQRNMQKMTPKHQPRIAIFGQYARYP